MTNQIALDRMRNSTAPAPASGATPAPRSALEDMMGRAMPYIQQSLPAHLTPERLLRLAITAVNRTPGLADCDTKTIVGAIMTAAQLGLEPNTPLGHCYLVPYSNRKARVKECQLIVGYQGFIDLAYRSGRVLSIQARAVRAGDHFVYQYGLEECLTHRPGDLRGEISHFYAVCRMKDGGHAFVVFSRPEMDQIMAETASKGRHGPWRDHFESMGCKTAIRRLQKFIPQSVEWAKAAAVDESSPTMVDDLDLSTLQESEPAIVEE